MKILCRSVFMVLTLPLLLNPERASAAARRTWRLEVIVYGLVGFVPDQSGLELMSFLIDGEKTTGEVHLPLLLLLQGDCEGVDCYQRLEDLVASDKIGRIEDELFDQNYKLLFSLKERELLMEVPPTGAVSRISFDAAPSIFPNSDHESLHWIPSLQRIAPPASKVRSSCFARYPGLDKAPCPITSRFQVGGWSTAIACHLVHNGRKEMIPYFFAPPGESPIGRPQVIADAIKLSWVFDSNFQIRLSTRSLSQAGIDDFKTVTPVDGLVRLLVWNHPAPSDSHQAHGNHFGAYYSPAASKVLNGPVPRRQNDVQAKWLGICESLFNQIGVVKTLNEIGIDSASHNIRECDAVAYAPTKLPARTLIEP